MAPRGLPLPLRRRQTQQSSILRYRPDEREQPSEAMDAAKLRANKLLVNLKALAEEAAVLHSKLAAHVPAQPSPVSVPANVLAARAWIAAWRVTQQQQQRGQASISTVGSGDDGGLVPGNVASARAWIAAWRASQQQVQPPSPVSVSSAPSSPVLDNVLQARAWIAAWRAAQGQHQSQQHAGAVPSVKQAAPTSAQGTQPASNASGAAPKPKQSAAAEAATAAPQGPFTNTNRYWVPGQLVSKFLAAVGSRKAALQRTEGFTGLTIQGPAGAIETTAQDGTYEVAISFASVAAWEAWSLSRGPSLHQLPMGVWQYVPAKGKGFPEDYLPFKDLSDPVNAKY